MALTIELLETKVTNDAELRLLLWDSVPSYLILLVGISGTILFRSQWIFASILEGVWTFILQKWMEIILRCIFTYWIERGLLINANGLEPAALLSR